jgi:hypothetical protein
MVHVSGYDQESFAGNEASICAVFNFMDGSPLFFEALLTGGVVVGLSCCYRTNPSIPKIAITTTMIKTTNALPFWFCFFISPA